MSAVATPKPGPVQHGLRAERRSEMIAGYVLISIPIVLFLVLNIGQIFYALYISFWDWGTRGPREFLGIGNYQSLLSDPIFWKAI